MSLFAVQQANDDMVLVIEAAVVVAADDWWVFRNADDRPVATLPTAAVCVGIPAQIDHLFRCKPITCSGANRSPVPAQTDHLLERSEAGIRHELRLPVPVDGWLRFSAGRAVACPAGRRGAPARRQPLGPHERIGDQDLLTRAGQ